MKPSKLDAEIPRLIRCLGIIHRSSENNLADRYDSGCPSWTSIYNNNRVSGSRGFSVHYPDIVVLKDNTIINLGDKLGYRSFLEIHED